MDIVSLSQGYLRVPWNISEEFSVRYSAIRVETSVDLKTLMFTLSILNDSKCMLEHCRIFKGLFSAAWHPVLVEQ